MDDRLFGALVAMIGAAAAAHCAARWPRMDAAERGAVEHGDTARRLRVAVWADVLRGGGR